MSAKTISLVLGSGGARGLAHIGVIDWLEEHGYQIESISGCSMGALVGGIHAAGKLAAYKDWVVSLERRDVIKMLDLSFGLGGLFKGEKIINKLRDLVGDLKIEDLDITFTAVATDIETGKEVWFTRGSLFDAIRASIAVPLVFTPVTKGKRVLLDGGLVNPVPIAPTMSDNTDMTIAVNVDSEPDDDADTPQPEPATSGDTEPGEQNWFGRMVDELQERFGLEKSIQDDQLGFYEVLTRSIEIMQNSIATMKMAAYAPDVTISISRDVARSYEFYRADELIKYGYQCAGHALMKK